MLAQSSSYSGHHHIILRSIIIILGSIVIILGSIAKIFETFDPKMMQIWETNLKITGPTGIFWENRDYKTITREPFSPYV